MRYGIKITKNNDGQFTVTCRDIPECVFDAPTEEKAKELSAETLPGTLVLFYRKNRRPIPLPSPVAPDEYPTYVPTRVQAKILLWNYMLENRYRLTDLAKALGIKPTQAQRLIDLSTDRASMEAIDEALSAIGASFDLSITKN